jgi:hypothetical protein
MDWKPEALQRASQLKCSRTSDSHDSTCQLRQETAALRDFDPAYVADGSESVRRCHLWCPVCPKADTERAARWTAQTCHSGHRRHSSNETLRNIGAVHPGLMPANLSTLAHFSVSLAINFPKSADIIGIGTPPRSASRGLILGSARPAFELPVELVDDLGRRGLRCPDAVPGARLVSGTNSPTVGMSGSTSERVAVVTATARSLLALMCSMDAVMGPKYTCTCPHPSGR